MSSSSGVWLGGETTSRGVLRTRRAAAGDIATLVVVAVVALVVLFVGGSSVTAFLAAAGVVAVGAGLCIPWELVRIATGGSSVRGWVGVRTGFMWRRLHGLTSFSSEDIDDGVRVPAGVGSLTSTDEVVGGLVVGVTEPTMAADRGTGRYLVTVVESQGNPDRLRGRPGTGWSTFLEFLGGEVSLASHVSTVTSVTDWDSTDHVWLVARDLERVPDPDRTLVGSYADVVDQVRARAAAQRTWVVLRFPVSAALRERGSDEDDLRRAVAEQTVAAIERAAGLGLWMRPLDTCHQAALCRHLMDPEVSADDLRGLGEDELGWAGAFPTFETSPDRRSLVVDGVGGQRWMTVWEVPAWSIAGQWLPQDFLYPAVTALSGRVARTFVVTAELEPPRRARQRARADVTSDLAALTKERTEVTDGSDETQATSSQIRLNDLRPGTSAVGARWSMAMAFHASSEEERVTYERRVLGALADSYVEAPDRLRYRQDTALGLVMPVCRAWRRSLAERMS